jgi:hypothetical protein
METPLRAMLSSLCILSLMDRKRSALLCRLRRLIEFINSVSEWENLKKINVNEGRSKTVLVNRDKSPYFFGTLLPAIILPLQSITELYKRLEYN